MTLWQNQEPRAFIGPTTWLQYHERPCGKRAEPRATWNNSWAGVGPSSHQGASNICLAGFQNCYGPVPSACFLFPSFLTRGVYDSYPVLVPRLYVDPCVGCRPRDQEGALVEKLYARTWTRRASCIPKHDIEDNILDSELML